MKVKCILNSSVRLTQIRSFSHFFASQQNKQMASLQLLVNAPVRAPVCALSKQGKRFLTSLATCNDDSDTHGSLRKFVKSSSKHVALNTLSHLLSPTAAHPPYLSSLVLPLYLMITEASWFSWNAKLVADVIAAIYKQGQFSEAETLIEETGMKLGVQNKRDLFNFYCYLIDSTAKHQLRGEVVSSCTRLGRLLTRSSSFHVKKRAYEAMIGGLCEIGMPCEAENLVGEMKDMGMKPSGFQFRSLVYAYGRLGLLEDMQRNVVAMESEGGFVLDTVSSNMVLSALGAQNDLSEMLSWLQRMKISKVPFSIRTYNSVLNSCPTIMSMLQDHKSKSIPLSVKELMGYLSPDEANLVMELVASSSVLEGIMEWNSSELKLDLHGLHLSSSFLIFLQWIDELQFRFCSREHDVPAEITLICGSGKHGSTRGVSPVKGLLKDMLIQMKCPLKIDRKNTGCFVAKGKVFRDWLCQFKTLTTYHA